MAIDDIDYVVAAWREEGRWVSVPLPPHAADTLDGLIHALRQQPGEGGSLALVSVAEDTAIIVRVQGDDLRVVMSDPTAAEDYDLAAEIADLVGLPDEDDDDEEEDAAIAGDPLLLADLGMPGSELELIFDDLDMLPDEMLEAVADRLGFPDDFRRARDDSTI